MPEYARFLKEFLRHPLRTGAVAPSSRWLAALMVRDMGLAEASTVAELGPGTGPFTRAILSAIGPDTLFVAVEINEHFAADLQARLPRVRIVNDSGERLDQHVRAAGGGQADCVLSGVPWASFPESLQHALLDGICRALKPGGRFATFAYIHAAWLPPARHFRRLLQARFAEIETTSVEWRNLPPAFVYRCRK